MKRQLLTILATGALTAGAFMMACNNKSTLQLPDDAKCACTGSYYQSANVSSPFVIANAFTPNGDGKNDLLRPVRSGTISPANYSLTVYEGALSVYHSTSLMDAGWDGRANGAGNTLPAGSYVARIKFTDDAGQPVSQCVCVHLLRNNAQGCVSLGGLNAHTLFFEDQFDPATGSTIYNTSETLCL